MARPLGRQGAGQVPDGGLGRVVRRLRLREVDAVRRDGRRQHDARRAAPRLHLRPRHRLRAEERPRRVDVQRAPPLGRRQLRRVRARRHPREREQHVHAAHGPHGRVDVALHNLGVCDVDTGRRDAGVRELSFQGGHPLGHGHRVEVKYGKPWCPVLEESATGREAQVTGTSCHNGVPVHGEAL